MNIIQANNTRGKEHDYTQWTRQKGRMSMDKNRSKETDPPSDLIESRYLRKSSTDHGFSCGFVREVYDLTARPISMSELCRLTDSDRKRVHLALNDLSALGIEFEVMQ